MKSNRIYKIVACTLAVMLAVSMSFSGQFVFGTEQSETETQTEATQTESTQAEEIQSPELDQVFEEQADSWRYSDGQYTDDVMDFNSHISGTLVDDPEVLFAPGDAGYGATNDKVWSFKYSGSTIKCSGGYLKGIDVSYWQHTIDWDKVKAYIDDGNLDFVILRCGYGTDSTSKDDSTFIKNAKACEKRNIPYGVYLYSYAKSQSNASSEAKHALRLLKDRYPQYPVYYDLEDKSILTATSKSKSKITGFANTFCSALVEGGYKAGVYANLTWFEKYVDGAALKKNGYDLWLAQWPLSNKNYSSYGYGKKYSIWQCCSSGSIPGIDGRVDLNLLVISYDEMCEYMNNYTAVDADIDEGYVKETVTSRIGPGQGFSPSAEYEEGTLVSIVEMANGYYHLGNDDWLPMDKIAAPTEPKELIQEELTEGDVHTYIATYDGSILTSEFATFGDKTYYATDTGDLATGLLAIGDYTYGFDENGVMYKDTKVVFDYAKYGFDTKGRSYLKKIKTKRKTVYRTGPSTDSTKKGTYKKGKSFYAINKSGDWYQLTNGYWVKTSYVKTTVLYPIYQPEIETTYKTKIIKKCVSRSGPFETYLKKKTYKKGAKVTVKGTYGDWAKLSSGYWVPKEMLKN